MTELAFASFLSPFSIGYQLPQVKWHCFTRLSHVGVDIVVESSLGCAQN